MDNRTIKLIQGAKLLLDRLNIKKPTEMTEDTKKLLEKYSDDIELNNLDNRLRIVGEQILSR